MFGRTFYHGTLRKYVIVFGNMFNGIYVQRFNNENVREQNIKVPIAYGPKEKFLIRISQDPSLDQEVALTLPRIGFEMTGVSYASNRKLPSTTKNVIVDTTDGTKLKSQYVPVPYDIQFQMSIFVKNADDGTQILEQILPYFQPEWTNNIKLIPEMNLVYDVPCVLNDVSVEDTYEGDFTTRRALIWNLNFTMKGYIFGPVSTAGTINRSVIGLLKDINIGEDVTGESVTIAPNPAESTADETYGIDKSIDEI